MYLIFPKTGRSRQPCVQTLQCRIASETRREEKHNLKQKPLDFKLWLVTRVLITKQTKNQQGYKRGNCKEETLGSFRNQSYGEIAREKDDFNQPGHAHHILTTCNLRNRLDLSHLCGTVNNMRAQKP